jgi:DNA invertase Pin-like site-specific DNA recombinase
LADDEHENQTLSKRKSKYFALVDSGHWRRQEGHMKIAVYTSNAQAVHAVQWVRDSFRNSQFLDYVEDPLPDPTAPRPVLTKVMLAAARQQFEVLIVGQLQELGSSLREVNHNVNLLNRSEIRLVIAIPHIDMAFSTVQGQMMARLLYTVVDFEADTIRQRIRAGIVAAQGRGKRSGRRPREIPLASAIRMRNRGKSWRAIGKALGLPASTVRGAVMRRQKSAHGDRS